MGMRKGFFEVYGQFGNKSSKRFASSEIESLMNRERITSEVLVTLKSTWREHAIIGQA